MRKVILFLLLFISVSVAQAQVKTKKVTQISTLRDSVGLLKEQNTTLIQRQEWRNETYEHIIAQATNTINSQNSFINTYSTIIGWGSLFVAVLGIGLPILLTYLFSIRPANSVMKKFDEEVNKRLKEYLTNDRKRRVEEAVTKLKSNFTQSQEDALRYLSFTTQDYTSDEHLQDLIQIIKHYKLSAAHKSQLRFFLSTQYRDCVTNYFSEVLINGDGYRFEAVKYFCTSGLGKYLYLFESIPLTAILDYYTILSYATQVNKESLLTLMNCNGMIDRFTTEDIVNSFIRSTTFLTVPFSLTSEELKNTVFYQKLLSTTSPIP